MPCGGQQQQTTRITRISQIKHLPPKDAAIIPVASITIASYSKHKWGPFLTDITKKKGVKRCLVLNHYFVPCRDTKCQGSAFSSLYKRL